MALTEYEPTALPEIGEAHKNAQIANGLLGVIFTYVAPFLVVAIARPRVDLLAPLRDAGVSNDLLTLLLPVPVGAVALLALVAWGTLHWSAADTPERVIRGAAIGLFAFVTTGVLIAVGVLSAVYLNGGVGTGWTGAHVVGAALGSGFVVIPLALGVLANWTLLRSCREPLVRRFEQHHSPAPEDPLRFVEPEQPGYPPPPAGVRFIQRPRR